MYALDFEVIGRNQILSVRFWKENTSVRVPLFRCPLVAGFPSTFITGLSPLLSVISFKPGLASVSGCPASLVRNLDNYGLFPRGVQYPIRFDALSLQTLMHKEGGGVFGSMDFFSQLRYLIVFLSGILTEPWTLESPELTKLGYLFFQYNFHLSLGPNESCVVIGDRSFRF